ATTIVDGSSLATTVTIAPAVTVVLDGLTITNGKARYGGGLYLGTASIVQLDGCVVTANKADLGSYWSPIDSYGGGIYADDPALPLASTTISNDYATYQGGGISAAAGTLTITDSTITQNTASHSNGYFGYGGGIVVKYGGALHLTRTTISSNQNPWG